MNQFGQIVLMSISVLFVLQSVSIVLMLTQENVMFVSILLTAVCIVITILLFDLLDDNIEDEDL